MQCPFCGAEMVEGELRSRGSNYFLPKGQKTPKLYTKASMEKVGAIMLPPDPLEVSLHPQCPIAYWCEGCRKLVIDCEE